MSLDFIENLIEASDFERRRCVKGECRLDKWRLNVEKSNGAERSIMCASRVFNFVRYMSIVYHRRAMCVERSVINIHYMHIAEASDLVMC